MDIILLTAKKYNTIVHLAKRVLLLTGMLMLTGILTASAQRPAVNSITRVLGDAFSSSAIFEIELSYPADNIHEFDLELIKTGTVTGQIQSVSGYNRTWTVEVRDISGNGTMAVNMNNHREIEPFAGTVYAVGSIKPAISISIPSRSFTVNSNVTYTVTYQYYTDITLSPQDVTVTSTGDAHAANVAVSGNGDTRTITLSNFTGTGTLSISLAAATAANGTLYANAQGPSNTFEVNNPRPTITIGAPSVTVTNGGPVTFQLTYENASSYNLTAADILVNKTGTATAGNVYVGGYSSTRTVTLNNITGDGTLSISVAAGTATNENGAMAAAAGPSEGFTVDNTPPAVTIGAPLVSSTATGPVSFPLTFSGQSSVGLNPWQITNNLHLTGNVYVGNVQVSGSGSNYTVTFSSISDGPGTLAFSIPSGTATDQAGNQSALTGPSQTVSILGPEISYNNTMQAMQTVQNSASQATSFTVAGTNMRQEIRVAAPLNFRVSLDNNNFYSQVTIGSSGTINSTTVYVRLASISSAGNYSGNITLSSTGVTSILLPIPQSTVTLSPTQLNTITHTYSTAGNATSINYYVAFNNVIAGLTTANFELIKTGTANGTIAEVAGSDANYIVTVNNISGDGTLTLQMVNATGINREITTTLPFTGMAYTVDNTPPAVTIGQPSPAITVNGPVTYSVNFDDAQTLNFNSSRITVNRTPASVNIGRTTFGGSGTNRTVTFENITGSGSFTFTVDANIARDAANNGNAATTSPVVYVGAPLITASAAALGSLSATDKDPSAAASFTVKGDRMQGAVTVTPPTAFEVSTDNSNFSNTLTVGAAGFFTEITVYVRLKAGNTPGNYNGNITLQSTGATTVNKALNTTNTVTNAPATATITRVVASPTNADDVNYTVTFSNAITGLTAANFNTSTTGTAAGSVASVTGSGTTYTVTINNITGDGNLSLTLANATGLNRTLTNTLPFAGAAYVIDNTPPVFTFTSVPGKVSGNQFTVTGQWESGVTLREAPYGHGMVMIVIPGSGHIQDFWLTGNSWNRGFSVTVRGYNSNTRGIGYVRVVAGAATDAAGNQSVDMSAPDIYIGTPQIRPNTSALPAFSGAEGTPSGIHSFAVEADMLEADVTVTAPTGFEVSTNQNGTYANTITLPIATAYAIAPTNVYVRLSASNTQGTYSGNIVLSSTIAPDVTVAIPASTVRLAATTITSITRTGNAATYGGTLRFNVTFNDALTGVTTNTFSLAITGNASGNINSVSGFGASYVVTVENVSGNGILGLTINDAGLDRPVSNKASFEGERYTIDTTPPQIAFTNFSAERVVSGSINFLFYSDDAINTPSHQQIHDAFRPRIVTTGTLICSSGYGSLGGPSKLTIDRQSGSGSATFSLPYGFVRDAAGNYSAGISKTLWFGPPQIAVSGAPSAVTGTQGGEYTTSSFTVQGNSIEAPILVTPPAGFRVSLDNNIFSNTVTIPLSSSYTVAPQPVYIRLSSSSAVGQYEGPINLTSSGATTVAVAMPLSTVYSPIISISGVETTDARITNATSVRYNITFSSNVAGLSASNFDIITNGTAAGSVTDVTGSGNQYTVTVGNITGDGLISLRMINDNGLNKRIASLPVTFVAYTIDNTPPQVVFKNIAAEKLTGNDKVYFDIDFGNAVNQPYVWQVVSAISSNTTHTGDVTTLTGFDNHWQRHFIHFLTGSGTATITLPAGFVTDATGNPSAAVSKTFWFGLPYISTSGSLSSLSTTEGNPSVSSYLNVGGELLDEGVHVTATGGFEVSLDDTNFSDTLTIPLSSKYTIASRPVYVRLAATTPAGTYTGNVTLTTPNGQSSTVIIPASTVKISNALTAIARTSNAITNADSLTYNVSFAAPLTGLTAQNFAAITSGTVTTGDISLTGSGNTYQVKVSDITGDGTLGIKVANDNGLLTGVTNMASFTGELYTIDNTPPAVAFTNLSAERGTESVSLMLDFGDAVNLPLPFNLLQALNSTVVNTGTLLGGVSVRTQYIGNTIGITPQVRLGSGSGSGSVTFGLPAGYVTDAAGNPSPAISQTVWLGPSVISTSGSLPAFSTVVGTASASARFDLSGESLTGDISVTAPTRFQVSLDNTTFSNTVTVPRSSSYTVASRPVYVRMSDVAALGEYSGRNILLSSTGATSVNVPIPTSVARFGTFIHSFTRLQGSNAVTNNRTVSFFIMFDVNVSGVSSSNFELVKTGTVNGTIASVQGANHVYTVTVNNITGDGTLGLAMANDNNMDKAVANMATFPSEVYTIDNTPPQVLINVSAEKVASSGTISFFADCIDAATTPSIQELFSHYIARLQRDGVSNGFSTWFDSEHCLARAPGPVAVTINIAEGYITDVAGNRSAAVSKTIWFGSPTITTSDTLRSISTSYGVPSRSQSFTVKGQVLDDVITVTAPANFEVSLDNTTFSNSLTVPLSSSYTIASRPVYVRLQGNIPQDTYSGNITLATLNVQNVTVAIPPSQVGPPATVAALLRTGNANALTNATEVSYTLVTEDAITGLTVNNFDLRTTGTVTGTVSSVTESGNSHTITVTGITGDGELALRVVNATGLNKQPGSTLPLEGPVYIIDNTPPAVEFTNISDRGIQTVRITVDFKDAINLPDPTSLMYALDSTKVHTGTLLSGFSVEGEYIDKTINVYPQRISGSGSVTFGLPAGYVTDAAGNPSAAISKTVWLGDPVVAIAGWFGALNTVHGTASASTSVMISGQALGASITVNAPEYFEVSLDNTTFSNQLTIPLSSPYTVAQRRLYVHLAANAPAGTYTNKIVSVFTNGVAMVLPIPTSVVKPVAGITSLTRYLPYSVTKNSFVYFAVSFNEDVSGISINNFELAKTGTVSGSISQVWGSGRDYVIEVLTITGDGTLGLIMANDNNLDRAITNMATLPSELYTIDNTPPQFILKDFSAEKVNRGSINFKFEIVGATNITDESTVGEYIQARLTFEDISGFGFTQFYDNIQITANYSESGTITINIPEGYLTDDAGNRSAAVSKKLWFGAPVITATGTLSALNTTEGTASSSVSLTTSGKLMDEPITVTPPDGFEVSLDDATFSSTLTIPVGAEYVIAPATVYVRLAAATLPGTYQGNIQLSSAGANTVHVPVPASIVKALPKPLLNTLQLSVGTLSPVFDKNTFEYTLTIPTTGGNVTLRPTSDEGTVMHVKTSRNDYGELDAGTVFFLPLADGPKYEITVITPQQTRNTYTINLGGTASVVSLTPVQTITNGSSVNYTLTFSEAVTGLTADNFTVTNSTGMIGAVTAVTDNGDNSWTITVTENGTADGIVRLNLANRTGLSKAIVTTLPYNGTAVTFNRTGPSAIFSAASLSRSKSGPVSYTLTYTGASLINLRLADIQVMATGGANARDAIANISGTGNTRRVTVSGFSGNGRISLLIGSGTAIDAAGNTLGTVTSPTFYVDNTGPQITASAPSVAKTDYNPVSYTLTYSGEHGVDDLLASAITLSADDIVLDKTGTANASHIEVTGSGFTRTVTLSGISGNGTLSISLKAGTATDTVGNLAATYTTDTFEVANNADLAKLGVSGTSLMHKFMPERLVNRASVITETVRIKPTAAAIGSTITVNGVPVVSGELSQEIALNMGSNTVNITVTAADGVTTQTYTLLVGRGSNESRLQSMDFKPTAKLDEAGAANGVINYTASVAAGTTQIRLKPIARDKNATVVVNGIPVPRGTTTGFISMNPTGATMISMTITAQDGVTTSNYSIAVSRNGSNNADLSLITLTPASVLTKTSGTADENYVTAVDENVSQVRIRPLPEDRNASITVNGVPLESGKTSNFIPLQDAGSPTMIAIHVTAQDGITTKNYLVTINRSGSNNARLKSIVLSPASVLVKGANTGNTINYTASVDASATQVKLKPTAEHKFATILVNGIPVVSSTNSGMIPLEPGGPTTINIEVTAQDGITKQAYTLTISRNGSNNAKLASITLNRNSTVTETSSASYMASVDAEYNDIRVRPMAEDKNATVLVDGIPINRGDYTTPIALNSTGVTVIAITVTAQDGTVRDYSLTIHKNGSNNVKLRSVTLKPPAPVVETSSSGYAATVPAALDTATVKALPESAYATLTINGEPVAYGASLKVPIVTGTNTITIVVTAQDGVTSKTYRLVITRQPPAQLATHDAEEENEESLFKRMRLLDVTVSPALSPNDDGINDKLIITGIEQYPQNSLSIMNSKGVQVTYLSGYNNNAVVFDGRNKAGVLQPQGTYFYMLEYKAGNDTKRKTGYIILKY